MAADHLWQRDNRKDKQKTLRILVETLNESLKKH